MNLWLFFIWYLLNYLRKYSVWIERKSVLSLSLKTRNRKTNPSLSNHVILFL